jgi:hypothetical protein
MSKSDEYRANAQSASGWRGISRKPDEKAAWLQMAAHWLYMIPRAGRTESEQFDAPSTPKIPGRPSPKSPISAPAMHANVKVPRRSRWVMGPADAHAAALRLRIGAPNRLIASLMALSLAANYGFALRRSLALALTSSWNRSVWPASLNQLAAIAISTVASWTEMSGILLSRRHWRRVFCTGLR